MCGLLIFDDYQGFIISIYEFQWRLFLVSWLLMWLELLLTAHSAMKDSLEEPFLCLTGTVNTGKMVYCLPSPAKARDLSFFLFRLLPYCMQCIGYVTAPRLKCDLNKDVNRLFRYCPSEAISALSLF